MTKTYQIFRFVKDWIAVFGSFWDKIRKSFRLYATVLYVYLENDPSLTSFGRKTIIELSGNRCDKCSPVDRRFHRSYRRFSTEFLITSGQFYVKARLSTVKCFTDIDFQLIYLNIAAEIVDCVIML